MPRLSSSHLLPALLACAVAALAFGCTPGDPLDGGAHDAAFPDDGGAGLDAGRADSGPRDAGRTDSGPLDSGPVQPVDGGYDAGPEPFDAGPLYDAGPPSDDAFTYWSGIHDDLVNAGLVNALHDKLSSTHNKLSYAELPAAYESTDWGRGGCEGIFDFYSSRCWSPSEGCGNYDEEGDCYNREHSWPKSWWGGSQSSDAYSDLFHVVPADGYVNNRRSNHPFAEVGTATYTSTNGSRVGTCSGGIVSATCFEPNDGLKGDFARIYFYMAVRYEGELGCCDEDAVDGADLDASTESLLRTWHAQDPVDQDERARNEAVFALQQSRNPFVDFPAWVTRIDDF